MGGIEPGDEGRVTRGRRRHRVVVVRLLEDDAVVEQVLQSTGEGRAKSLQVVEAGLIDADENEEARRVRSVVARFAIGPDGTLWCQRPFGVRIQGQGLQSG